MMTRGAGHHEDAFVDAQDVVVFTQRSYVVAQQATHSRQIFLELFLPLGQSRRIFQELQVLRVQRLGAAPELVDLPLLMKKIVRAGPNLEIGPEFLYDGCHPSRVGAAIFAQLWLDALSDAPQ